MSFSWGVGHMKSAVVFRLLTALVMVAALWAGSSSSIQAPGTETEWALLEAGEITLDEDCLACFAIADECLSPSEVGLACSARGSGCTCQYCEGSITCVVP